VHDTFKHFSISDFNASANLVWVKQLETLNHVGSELLVSKMSWRRVSVFAEFRWQIDPIDSHFRWRVIVVAVSVIVNLKNEGCGRSDKFVYAGCGSSSD
jgi:hypothetical protein